MGRISYASCKRAMQNDWQTGSWRISRSDRMCNRLLLSIVVPCYNEEQVLRMFYKRTVETVAVLPCECNFLFVDDGSKDGTLDIMKELAQMDARVHYLSLSRNFGKEAALMAGLEHAKGDLIVLMDADLQDPPELLPEMIHCITEEGFDCVGTRRVTREGEPIIRSFFARQFYKIIRGLSHVDVVDGARDFRMMTRTMVNAIISLRERQRFSKGIFGWVGFRTKWLEYENTQRAAGETKWSFWKLFSYALDGIFSFSAFPLHIVVVLGVLISVFAFAYLIFVLLKTLIFGIDLPGYASQLITVLFLGGIQLIAIGIVGEYISRIYTEAKNRPIYIIREQTKQDNK